MTVDAGAARRTSSAHLTIYYGLHTPRTVVREGTTNKQRAPSVTSRLSDSALIYVHGKVTSLFSDNLSAWYFHVIDACCMYFGFVAGRAL